MAAGLQTRLLRFRMIPNPIIIRSVRRRGSACELVIEEHVEEECIVHTLDVDDATFAGFERALRTHPFKKKRPEDDVVLFKGLTTPLDTDTKFVDLQIINDGSRSDLRIEASDVAFSELEEVFRSWSARMDARRVRAV